MSVIIIRTGLVNSESTRDSDPSGWLCLCARQWSVCNTDEKIVCGARGVIVRLLDLLLVGHLQTETNRNAVIKPRSIKPGGSLWVLHNVPPRAPEGLQTARPVP